MQQLKWTNFGFKRERLLSQKQQNMYWWTLLLMQTQVSLVMNPQNKIQITKIIKIGRLTFKVLIINKRNCSNHLSQGQIYIIS